MFGLTFEKLFLILLLAAIVIGPRRLPEYAGQLGRGIRRLRAFVDGARDGVTETTGVPIDQWRNVDLSRYDPRRIMRDALADDPVAERRADAAAPAVEGDELPAVELDQPPSPAESPSPAEQPSPAEPPPSIAPLSAPRAPAWTDAEIAAVRPGQRFVIVGGSAHPRRIAIADLAEDDPVRRAAEADDPAVAV